MRMEIRRIILRRVFLSLSGLSVLALAAAVGIQPPNVPNNLKLPEGQMVLLKAVGQGVQIYACSAKAGDPTQFEWVLKAPEADLMDTRGRGSANITAGQPEKLTTAARWWVRCSNAPKLPVQWPNTKASNISFQVFSKSTGRTVFGPAEISSIFSGVPGACGSGPDYTDPVALYDKAAGRWLVTILASSDGFKTGFECFAVSITSDATGSYNRYAFSFSPNLNDDPKFGVWPDAYYGSYNMFSASAFLGAKVCAYSRGAMLAGKTALSICFQRPTSDFTLLPSDLDGHTAPPAGEPNFLLELATSTTLNLFKFHVDFTTPANSTFTGPTMLTVPSFTEACAATGTCIPQPGTTQRLDSLGDRMMFRLVYRKFASHEALVATHSEKTSAAASGVRWYEIRNPNTSPTVFQRGTVTAGSTSLWMGSIGMDKVGDIALGFSESSSSLHPAVAYIGRVPTDPPGTMESIDVTFKGNGSQTSSLSRWGDYSSVSIDPSDDCTFWYANEYIPSNGIFNWHTRLNSFKFTSCK